jgi:hypothetical protein
LKINKSSMDPVPAKAPEQTNNPPVVAAALPEGRGSCAPVMVAALVWLTAVVSAMGWMASYSNLPGRAGVIPVHWPAQSQIPLDTGRPTLVMFVHPHCPCTRASLGELDLLMARCQGRLSAHVVMIQPEGTTEEWLQTDLWRTASAIPGVTVHTDNAGAESQRFQTETSGQTVLYDRNGNLLFAGGITISRGHAGDNPGRSALAALLKGEISNQVKTPVFGCSLFDTECRKETPHASR